MSGSERQFLKGAYSELQSLSVMIKEHLAKVPPVGEIELEEHLASQSNVPPKIVPSGEASVDRIAKLLRVTNKRR